MSLRGVSKFCSIVLSHCSLCAYRSHFWPNVLSQSFFDCGGLMTFDLRAKPRTQKCFQTLRSNELFEQNGFNSLTPSKERDRKPTFWRIYLTSARRVEHLSYNCESRVLQKKTQDRRTAEQSKKAGKRRRQARKEETKTAESRVLRLDIRCPRCKVRGLRLRG